MPQRRKAIEKSNFVMFNAEPDEEETGFVVAMDIIQSVIKVKPKRRYFGRRLTKKTKTYLN